MRHIYKGIFVLGTLYLLLGTVFAKDRNLPGIKIITRAQWGADESIRYSTQPAYKVQERLANKSKQELQELQESDTDAYLNTKRAQYEKDMANDYLATKYASEQTIDDVHYEYLGNYLKRPESIHNSKIEIIVHHTAGDYTSLLT